MTQSETPAVREAPSWLARVVARAGPATGVFLGAVSVLGLWVAFGNLPGSVALLLSAGAAVIAWAFSGPVRAVQAVAAAPPRATRAAGEAALLDAVLANLPEPVLIVDDAMRIRVMNRAATDSLGTHAKRAPFAFAVRAPQVAEAVEAVLAGAEPATVTYYEKVPVDRWFEAHVCLIENADATPEAGNRVLVYLRDLTQQQRTELMRSDFIANASHELRTPLASVTGFIETLQGPARNDAEARERFLNIMAVQANRMSRLIDDLMSLSRIEQKVHLRPGDRVNLDQVVGHVRDSLAPIAEENGVEIVVEATDRALEAAPSVVLGDQDELTQVVQNLVENAIKYGKSGGRVELTVDRIGAPGGGPGQIEINVRDHGPGIAPEHLPRLTERFYRADVESSRETGGTGLGLAIVKHILNRHRGTLSVDSTVGQGALFSIRLDAAPSA